MREMALLHREKMRRALRIWNENKNDRKELKEGQ